MVANDWRDELLPRSRRRAVKEMMNDIKEYREYNDEGDLEELEKICQSFEQKAFVCATSKRDYLEKIESLADEMQRKCQEEIHHKIKILKEVYVPELVEMYQIIANRRQQIQMLKEVHFPYLTEMFFRFARGIQQQDSLPQQVESDNHEVLGFFRRIFEDFSSFIALYKFEVLSASFRKDLVAFEESIVNVINKNKRWKMHHTQQQSQLTQVCRNENQIDSQCEFQTVYRKIQMLKEIYLPELNDMHQIITNKIWKIDNHAESSNWASLGLVLTHAGFGFRRPRPDPYERPKLLKIKEILWKMIGFLQASKTDISPALKEELHTIEDQIITFININRSNVRGCQQSRFNHKLYVPSETGNMEEFTVNEK